MSVTRDRTDLVAAARAGDRDALSQLLVEHRPLVMAACCRMMGDRLLAEEAVQEASMTVLLNLDLLRRPDRFGPWFTGIALNVCRHRLRDRRRERLFADPPASAAADAELDAIAALEASAVRRAVAGLPAGQRAAVLLFYVDDLSQAEVAAQLGIAPGAVKARLHKARAALRARLTPQMEGRPMTVRTSQRHVEMEVAGVRRLRRGEHEYHVLTLTELGGNRYLPLWIGPSEATSIALRLENARGLRPTTAALAADLLLAAGGRLREVRIERLDENVLYAVAVVDGASGVREVDARPSDAINVALLTGSPITVSEPVLTTVWAKMAAETVRPSFDEVAGAADIAAEATAMAPARHRAKLPPELRSDG
jgi:RNA polymerase sigma factor (sigma-70 family)